MAQNTARLRAELGDIANLDYVSGPPLNGNPAQSPRPWWVLDRNLEYNRNTPERWRQTVSIGTARNSTFETHKCLARTLTGPILYHSFLY